MSGINYIDVFTAKDRVVRVLREYGAQSYSRLLLNTQLPEEILDTALRLLEKEQKIRHEAKPQDEEVVYLPAAGFWSGAFR